MSWSEDDLQRKGFDKNGKRAKQSLNVGSNEEAPVTDLAGAIFIPYEVPSFKNSKRIVKTKEGKPKIIASKAWYSYKKATSNYYRVFRSDFQIKVKDKNPPYNIMFTFVRSTKRKFDYNNISQGVTDLMVEFNWIEDDDYTNLKPHFGDVIIDKSNPGVYIKVVNGVTTY